MSEPCELCGMELEPGQGHHIDDCVDYARRRASEQRGHERGLKAAAETCAGYPAQTLNRRGYTGAQMDSYEDAVDDCVDRVRALIQQDQPPADNGEAGANESSAHGHVKAAPESLPASPPTSTRSAAADRQPEAPCPKCNGKGLMYGAGGKVVDCTGCQPEAQGDRPVLVCVICGKPKPSSPPVPGPPGATRPYRCPPHTHTISRLPVEQEIQVSLGRRPPVEAQTVAHKDGGEHAD